MERLRKPPMLEGKEGFFITTSPIRRMAFCGTFLLILWFVFITIIPPAHGASSLYLPLIMKPPVCDPASTQIGDPGDNEQILFGTPGDDHFCQYGFGGNDIQYAAADEGGDTIFQDGGPGDDHQTAIAGDGNDSIIQYGGEGKDTMYAEGGLGEKSIFQDGGPGDDNMEIGGGRGGSRIIQLGGLGNDVMKLEGSSSTGGDDIITLNAGEGNDTITYIVTSGTDTVHIDGGPGDDTLTVRKAGQNFTIFDGGGSVICQAGVGGTTITVVNVEHITAIGDNGETICQWP